jgi:hypothetical protein
MRDHYGMRVKDGKKGTVPLLQDTKDILVCLSCNQYSRIGGVTASKILSAGKHFWVSTHTENLVGREEVVEPGSAVPMLEV